MTLLDTKKTDHEMPTAKSINPKQKTCDINLGLLKMDGLLRIICFGSFNSVYSDVTLSNKYK